MDPNKVLTNGTENEKKTRINSSMGSRSEILRRIKANKPALLALPDIDNSVFDQELDLVKEFTKKVEVVGGSIYPVSSQDEVFTKLKELYPEAKENLSMLNTNQDFSTISLDRIKQPKELEDLDILALESNLGVAENGAIWLEDKDVPERVLPFITKHLVLVLDEKNIVPYMHDAYENLSDKQADYGVFISGPSKTADIEQSLVIGAHGALSLTVFLLLSPN